MRIFIIITGVILVHLPKIGPIESFPPVIGPPKKSKAETLLVSFVGLKTKPC
jgi:hypothetical protein